MGLCLQLEVRLATEEVDSVLASGHQFQPSKAELGGPGGPSILGRTPTPQIPVPCLVSESCHCEQKWWWAQCSLGVLSRGYVTGQIQFVHKNLSGSQLTSEASGSARNGAIRSIWVWLRSPAPTHKCLLHTRHHKAPPPHQWRGKACISGHWA